MAGTPSLHERHLMRASPFDADELERITGIKNWDTDFTHCEVEFRDPLYSRILTFVQEFKDDVGGNEKGFNHSYKASHYKLKKPLDGLLFLKSSEENPEEEAMRQRDAEKKRKKGMYLHNQFSPGLGLFRFSYEGNIFYALHQAIGNPIGDDLMVAKAIVLFVQGRGKSNVMQELIDAIYEHTKREDQPDQFNIYRYNARFRQWVFSHKAYGRSVESVVLPKDTKDSIMEDLDEFLHDDTKAWYLKHGIPYKRCYLFYGVPGSGKTSLISVIANLHDRAVCYLTPTDEYMSDDSLRHAVQNLPEKSVVIMEDIDALFSSERQTKTRNSLTFSGLLNALDGVGSGLGQVFILSTNYREKLDKALIRNGRVDLHVKFDWIKRDQAREMFKIFYEDAEKELAEEFSANLFTGLGSKKISAATLQHFFILYRKRSANDAVKDIAKKIRSIVRQQETEKDLNNENSVIYS